MDSEAVQEILKKHSKWLHSNFNDGERAEMAGMDLSNFDLREVLLCMADLSGVDLRGANLLKANLKNATLKGAYLREAELRGINLIDADLTGVNCIKANLREAFLRDTTFNEAHGMDADFREANLINANLSNANLRGADLRGATLAGANLSKADLRDAKLRGANLRGAILTGALCANADLSKTDFNHSDLTDADLTGADVRGATFVATRFYRATFDNAELSDLKIDNDSYDEIPSHIRDKFEKSWRYLKFQDHSRRESISWSLPMQSGYMAAAVSLLTYFPVVLMQKYPHQKIHWHIEPNDAGLLFWITLIEGNRDIVERAMNEYADFLAGQLGSDLYTDDPYLACELKEELACARYRIESQQRLNRQGTKIDISTTEKITLEALCTLLRQHLVRFTAMQPQTIDASSYADSPVEAQSLM